MPYRLDTHVLTVDANVIHKVDTANPANLYSMWTDSLEQGRRLENLSWRLWQREQLVDLEMRQTATQQTSENNNNNNNNNNTSLLPSTTTRSQDLPQLSGSVESLVDEDSSEFTSESALDILRPRIHRLDSTSSRTRRDRHISSDDFGKMVVSIVNDTAPLSAPTAITSPLAAAPKVNMAPKSMHVPKSTMHVVPKMAPETRTLAPSQATVGDSFRQLGLASSLAPIQATVGDSFRQLGLASSLDAAIPEPKSSPAHQPVAAQKKLPAKFALGGSCSSSEQGMSVELPQLPPSHSRVFQIGSSSDSASKKAIQPAKSVRSDKMKQTTVSAAAAAAAARKMKQATVSSAAAARNPQQLHVESAIDSDSDDDVDESAIDDDDDDDSEWEDSIEESGKSSVEEKFFQRVESKANLVSRPSLITLLLAKDEREKALGNAASQSASAISRSRAGPAVLSTMGGPLHHDSDEGQLMMKGMRPSNLKPIIEAPRCSAQPIMANPSNHVHAQAALSPRTTRRNMLATELTDSLRLHLLWERQQKTSTANAVLKRRHTSHDVANLKQFPEKACMKKSEDGNAGSWNQYFNKDTFDGYHSKGW